jgi:hypothetical protein
MGSGMANNFVTMLPFADCSFKPFIFIAQFRGAIYYANGLYDFVPSFTVVVFEVVAAVLADALRVSTMGVGL